MKCKGAKKNGTPCRNNAKKGEKHCAAHAGTAKRPLKLTPKVQATIVTAIKNGNYVDIAVKAAGIGLSTYYRWMETGEADAEHNKKSSFRDFWEAVSRASNMAEVEAVEQLRKAFPEDWRAVVAFLERRYPGRWGRRQVLEHTGPDGGPVNVVSDDLLSDPETRDLLAELRRRVEASREEQSGGLGAGD